MTNLLQLLTEETVDYAALQQMASNPPHDVLEILRSNFRRVQPQARKRFVEFAEGLRQPGVDELLLEWIENDLDSAPIQLLGALNHRRLRPSRELLLELMASRVPEKVIAGVAGAGHSGDQTLAPMIASNLDKDRIAAHAALALAQLGAVDYTPAIIERISKQDRLGFQGFAIALEIMQDERAVAPLLRVLQEASDDHVFDLNHALSVLTGWEPVGPRFGSQSWWADQVRAAWGEFSSDADHLPEIRQMSLESGAAADFELHNSSGIIRLDHDWPKSAATWPRWDRSVTIDGERVYHAGSDCGTCEAILLLAGFPRKAASMRACVVRDAVADVKQLDQQFLENLSGLIDELRPGNYRAYTG